MAECGRMSGAVAVRVHLVDGLARVELGYEAIGAHTLPRERLFLWCIGCLVHVGTPVVGIVVCSRIVCLVVVHCGRFDSSSSPLPEDDCCQDNGGYQTHSSCDAYAKSNFCACCKAAAAPTRATAGASTGATGGAGSSR